MLLTSAFMRLLLEREETILENPLLPFKNQKTQNNKRKKESGKENGKIKEGEKKGR